MQLKHCAVVVILSIINMLLARQDGCENSVQYEQTTAAFRKAGTPIQGVFPWTVMIFENKQMRCFGNLLVTPAAKKANATDLVLTAYGCSKSTKEKNENYLEKLFVRIGIAEHEKLDSYTVLTVSDAISFLTDGQADGVGVFKLRNPAIFDDNVKPICLQDADSKLADLSDCFFSSFDFNKRYMINKVTTCGTSSGIMTEICYLTDGVLPPIVYGSAIVCSKGGSSYAPAIIVKKLVNRKPSVKNEKRAEVSFVSPLEELYKYVRLNSTLPNIKTGNAEASTKKVKPDLPAASASPNTVVANTMKQPAKKKPITLQSFNVTVVKKRHAGGK
ncbi:hypothetical protein D918_08032 [Trichuris suis]|nr:hypothetical protein D918_08032 [Trichuris suis]